MGEVFRMLRLTFHRIRHILCFFDLFPVYLTTMDHLNIKLLMFVNILQVLKISLSDCYKSWVMKSCI